MGFVRRMFYVYLRSLSASFSFSSFFFVPPLSLPQGAFTFPMYYWCSVNMGFEISLSLCNSGLYSARRGKWVCVVLFSCVCFRI